MKLGEVVKINWRDSNLYITQCNVDDDFEVALLTSIGELVKETDDYLVLAGDVLKDGEIRRVIVIPKENIIHAT